MVAERAAGHARFHYKRIVINSACAGTEKNETPRSRAAEAAPAMSMAPSAKKRGRTLAGSSDARPQADAGPQSVAALISEMAANAPPQAPPQAPRAPLAQLVSPELRLLPPHDTAALSPAARRLAQEQACAVVRAEDPLLLQLLEVRVITTHRLAQPHNHVNLRFAQEFCTMVHHERAGRSPAETVMFCFMASDQLEPVIVAVAVHPDSGRLQDITHTQLQQLEVAIAQLKHRFQLEGETYAYTGVKERLTGSWHSRHFHLKIRIPTEMYLQTFPAMQVLARNRNLLEPCKRKWEPLAYKFERQPTAPWPEVRRLMLLDIEGA